MKTVQFVEFQAELGLVEVEDRDQILEYLGRGTLVRVSTARNPDPLDRASGRTYSIGWMSDGELIWDIQLVELLEDYPTLKVPSAIVRASQTKPLPVPLSSDELNEIVSSLS